MPLEDFYGFIDLIEEHYEKEKKETSGNGSNAGTSAPEPKPIGAVIPRQ